MSTAILRGISTVNSFPVQSVGKCSKSGMGFLAGPALINEQTDFAIDVLHDAVDLVAPCREPSMWGGSLCVHKSADASGFPRSLAVQVEGAGIVSEGSTLMQYNRGATEYLEELNEALESELEDCRAEDNRRDISDAREWKDTEILPMEDVMDTADVEELVLLRIDFMTDDIANEVPCQYNEGDSEKAVDTRNRDVEGTTDSPGDALQDLGVSKR
eukprot:GEMP01014998.1.p2 GENE.GEMP01014998.1~~GEMP01014998.1.p2  ORF type:complete len:215 (-),score=47.83 GEMP01014998.1:126-770(-)